MLRGALCQDGGTVETTTTKAGWNSRVEIAGNWFTYSSSACRNHSFPDIDFEIVIVRLDFDFIFLSKRD